MEETGMDMKGKVVIITGAGKGIGRGTAIDFAKAGAKVVLVGGRPESIEAVKKEIEAFKGEAVTMIADVANFVEVNAMVKKVVEMFGQVDVLVNNAGIASSKKSAWVMPTLEIDDDEWDRVLAVNLKGQFNCSKAVIPFMMERKKGSIVNLSSTTALNPGVGSAPYIASKAGIMALTRVLAKELGPYGIRVNCVAPGFTLTPMQDGITQEAIDMVSQMIPLKRAGLPEDLAKVIMFFASDDLFVTGQTLLVDGGSTMH
jgi:3-oxoacyl-[acyl-carrier protein] reductase